MIVISDDVVLTAAEQQDGVNADNPRIGWHTIITPDNISASASDADWPVSNLGNPATFLKWKGTNTDVHTLTVSETPAEVVNYFAVAGHNFGSGGIAVKLQQSSDGSAWTDLTDEFIPGDDHALMVEFADTTASQYYRLVCTPGSEAPEIGALNIGRVLRMQRRLYVGYKPPTLNRTTTVSSGHAEEGQYLGRVKRRQLLDSDVPFNNLTPDWVRDYFDEFQEAAETLPFFFAWRPDTWPAEVAYMWFKSDPDLVNERPNGMMALTMKMQGIR